MTLTATDYKKKDARLNRFILAVTDTHHIRLARQEKFVQKIQKISHITEDATERIIVRRVAISILKDIRTR